MKTEFSRESGRLLQKSATFEYILLGDLRDILEEPPSAETSRWLLAILDALLDTLPFELELKAENGYLSEVLEEFPNWWSQVEVLRLEHENLFQKLEKLRFRVASQDRFADIADEVGRDLHEWMLALKAHHRHENRMLQTALNLEVGCGD